MPMEVVAEAIRHGLGFLIAGQSAAGAWVDWRLPVGPSDMWTTAYASFRLGSLNGTFAAQVRPALTRAARWLLAAQLPGGGWGYSQSAGVDADSTALAILSLAAAAMPPEERCYQRLLSFQRPDGGFSTFRPPQGFGAWALSHPEVTATAVMALLTKYDRTHPAVARAIHYVLGNRATDGLWHSYWWDSRLYATDAALRMLSRAGVLISEGKIREALAAVAPRNCFEQALLILSQRFVGEPASVTGTTLARQQHEDGSWPIAPILRLTDPRCIEPWSVEAAGELFADERRIFSTATVVAALGNVELP